MATAGKHANRSRARLLLCALCVLAMVENAPAQQDTVFISVNVAEDPERPVYRTDTVIFESAMMRHVLTGTTILPLSARNVSVKDLGLDLVGLELVPCSNPGTEKPGPNELVSVSKSGSTWTIETRVASNCCHSFLGEAEAVNDSTLSLVYTGYGGFCSCICCFGLRYELDAWYPEHADRLKYFMINGDLATMRRFE